VRGLDFLLSGLVGEVVGEARVDRLGDVGCRALEVLLRGERDDLQLVLADPHRHRTLDRLRLGFLGGLLGGLLGESPGDVAGHALLDRLLEDARPGLAGGFLGDRGGAEGHVGDGVEQHVAGEPGDAADGLVLHPRCLQHVGVGRLLLDALPSRPWRACRG
jgi:hypothetical protein